LNPAAEIKILNSNMSSNDYIPGENLSFISNVSSSVLSNEENWKVVVGRDIIVPVINGGNPFLNELQKKGVSAEMFAQALNSPEKQNWGTILGTGQHSPIHVYVVSDETVKAGFTHFIESDMFPASPGIIMASKEEVIAAVQNDPYAIGFCKLINMLGPENQGLAGNLKFLPIDKNGNRTIDYMENIYGDVNTFLRGVWIGKYPKSLYSTIYAVRKVQSENETETAFLSWVLTDGQQYMNANGFCELVSSESQSQLDRINPIAINMQPEADSSNTAWILLFVAMIIVLGIIVSVGVRHYRKQSIATPEFNEQLPGFDEGSVIVPKGIYFDKTHTWAFMEKDGMVTLGIDDFIQHITGPVTRIEMKNPGETIRKGDLLFTIIQSGKQLNMYAPVSGTIMKQNELLLTDPSNLNTSPYSEGWVYMIEPSGWFREIQLLEMSEKYKKWLSAEFSRMKDFLAAILKPESDEYAHVVLQDGGLMKEGVLSEFGPEVWEDFQTNFLDTFK
jgi:glycine cleavage system H lipoate-binding protein